MALNETSQPTTETRDENEISPVDNPASANRDDPRASTTRSRPQGSANEDAPPLPTRPTGSSIVQPPSPARQQPLPQPYPQYQFPYAPYPYQPQPYSYTQPMRMLPPYSKSWTVNKLVLTIISIVLAIVILALACVFLGEGGDAEYTAYYGLPISIAAVLWNGAELITFGVRSRKDVKRGIHPGAHVALHLCFWIACVFAVLITSSIAVSIRSIMMTCSSAGDSRYGYYSYCDDYHYTDGLYMDNMYLPTLRAMIALFSIATVNHFILFVLACIDTHRRNCLQSAGVIMAPPPPGSVYYPPPPPAGVPPYYPYPMPMPPRQAHFAPPNAPAAPGTEPKTLNANTPAQNYQNLAGFYAPAPPQASSSPTRRAASPSNEKAVASSSAPPGQAL
ncbi:hypothetical protein F4677DRAFT_329109 [Hypoxylon crocopeplum]|nr:hypothetical protein F4677DRAFT_329109 [Hypoxylon crocopeplum]